MQRARKRAPKSLNAAVGPWNSSSTQVSSSASGFSGSGKSKASLQIVPSSPASASPAKNGVSNLVAIAGNESSAAKSAGLNEGSDSGT